MAKVRPLHDRLLVKRIEEKETVKGGIIIPDTAKEKPREGEVIAVPTWARLIAKVYQTDPLVCTRCGQRMSLIAFVTDQMAARKILDHLGLATPETAKPPPPAREVLRVAEQGEGWGAPQHWDPA